MAKIKYKKLISKEQIDIMSSWLAVHLVNEIVEHNGYCLYLNVLEGATPLYNVLYDKIAILDPWVRKSLISDSVKIKSYTGTENTGFVIEKDSELSKTLVKEQAVSKVIIIDDILDSGNTMYNLIELLKTRGFTEFVCITLLSRSDESKLHPDAFYYTGHTIEGEWVCGFGMDSLDGTYRDKKDIYEIIN